MGISIASVVVISFQRPQFCGLGYMRLPENFKNKLQYPRTTSANIFVVLFLTNEPRPCPTTWYRIDSVKHSDVWPVSFTVVRN